MIAITDEQDAVRLPARKIRALVRAVLAGEGMPEDASLSLAFVDDRAIRKLNRKFLKHDFATDVISFPLAPRSLSKLTLKVQNGEGGLNGDLFGEVVISTQYAAREAKKRGIAVEEELLRYVVHGVLHLVGYDDRTPAKKRDMWERQERYLLTFITKTRRPQDLQERG